MAQTITASLLIDLDDNNQITNIKVVSQALTTKTPKTTKTKKEAEPLLGDVVVLDTKVMLSQKLLDSIGYVPGMRVVFNYTTGPDKQLTPVIGTAATMGKSTTSYIVTKAGSIRMSGNPYSLLKAYGTVFDIANVTDKVVTLVSKVKDANVVAPSTKTDAVDLSNMPTSFTPATTQSSSNNNDLTEVSSEGDELL